MISLGNTIALYADDCKTFWIIDNPQDYVLFQHDHLCSWRRLNSMDFNIKKCKLMRISRKEQPLNTNLLMHDSSLDIISEFKDLGLLVSYNLSWNSHINCIVSNAIRMLVLISCIWRSIWHTCIKDSLLFISEIPGGVQFGCLVTSHQEEHWFDIIECVQRRATKLILKSKSNNHESRLKELNLDSLEQGRFIPDVTFLYKVLNGYLNVDFRSLPNFYCLDDHYTF